MTLWVRWKKPIKPLIKLDPDDLENAQDTEGNAGDKGRPVIPVNPKPQEKDAFESGQGTITNSMSTLERGCDRQTQRQPHSK